MAEIHTADSAAGVKTSPLTTTPKAKAKATGKSTTPKEALKVNARGVPVTVWDNDKNDPNKRVHAGDDPEGEQNKLVEK